MTNMKSEVCKKANAMIKTSFTKSEAFKMAWAEVKKAAKSVKTSDLTAGQVIRIEYGCAGNFLTATVIKTSDNLFYGRYVVTAFASGLNREIEFCALPDELIEKAA